MNSTSPTENAAARRPLAVIIDDVDQADFAELVTDEGVDAVALGPDDLDPELLARATAVILDQYLDEWPGRDRLKLPPTLHVPDGLAMAAVLRSHVENSGSKDGSHPASVAFALRTGELDRLGAGLPKAAREYLLARQYNLEWVFGKGEDPLPNLPTPARRIASLAYAASTLPQHWNANSGNPGIRWLDLPNTSWAEDAMWQIEQCRPPQHVVAERSAGMAWLRWFLHRILPFPTFLLDRTRLAVALGISTASAEEVLASESPLAARLGELRYSGPFNDFLGDRWWRAGVSYIGEELLDVGQRHGFTRSQAVASGAGQLHGQSLDMLTVEDPVVGVNADYSVLPIPLSSASAVRLQPDDWPPYADDAWAARDTLSADDADPELLALVVSTDRWRIHGDDGDPPTLPVAPQESTDEKDLGEDHRRTDTGKRLP